MSETSTRCAQVGAILAAIAIATGAFGAHGLANMVDAHDLDIWRKGAHYHLIHAVALVALSRFGDHPRMILGRRLLVLGTLIFSGSLYALVLSQVRALGAVTPIGGTLMIAGWVWIAMGMRPGGSHG